MNAQLVDLGTSIALLGVVVTVLSRVVLASTRDLKDHLRRQDESQRAMDSRLTGLENGQDRLRSDVAGLKVGQERLESDVAGLKVGQERLESDVAGLKVGQQGLANTLGLISPRLERMDGNIIDMVRDVGEVKGSLGEVRGRLESIAPKERVGADS